MNIAILDIVFIVIALVITIKTSMRGFIEEFFSKAAVILGALGAIVFFRSFTSVVNKFINLDYIAPIVSFLILFLAIYIVIKILQSIFGSLFKSDSLSSFDKALGFFLGLLESFIVIFIILFVLHIQNFINVDQLLRDSIIAQFLLPIVVSHNFELYLTMLEDNLCLKI